MPRCFSAQVRTRATRRDVRGSQPLEITLESWAQEEESSQVGGPTFQASELLLLFAVIIINY